MFFTKIDFLQSSSEIVQTEMTDEQLVQRMQSGDDRAFELLYDRYFEKIYRFVMRRVWRSEIAEDLVSEIFLKAFAKRHTFVWRVSFSAWIYRIATNAITDYIRTRKPIEELPKTLSSHEAHSSAHVDQEFLGNELELVLARLDPREQLAITMKFFGECSNVEIATALRVNVNHAGVILHRALKKCEQYASEKLRKMFV